MAQKRRIKRPPTVDVGKYGGKWIAWDHNNRKVVASGRTYLSAHTKAIKAGEENPVLQKVPKGFIIYSPQLVGAKRV